MDIYIPVSVIRLSLIINSLYDFLTVRVDLNNNNNNLGIYSAHMCMLV